jgi:hypothetical protein
MAGLPGFDKKDSNTAERQAGEDLGIQKMENANATAGLNEVQTAVAPRDENHAAVAAILAACSTVQTPPAPATGPARMTVLRLVPWRVQTLRR